MDSMEAVIQSYADKYGILDFKTQTKELSKAYFKNPGKKEVADMYHNFIKYGQYLNDLNEHLWRVRGTYNDLKLNYENAMRDVKKKLTYANMVTKPYPADKKTFPIRWLIVLSSVISSVILGYIILLLMDARKKVRA